MLVLSRKVGERILIGDQVAITVVRINATTVRLGIDAPSKLVVVREELAKPNSEPVDDRHRDAAQPTPR